MPTTGEVGVNQLIEALRGLVRASANGNSVIKDNISPAILIVTEILAELIAAEAVVPESRIEQRARRLAEMENSLVDLEPRQRATVARARLGLSKTGYYRDRAVAKNMRIL